VGPNFVKGEIKKLSYAHSKDLIDRTVDLPRMSREDEDPNMQSLALLAGLQKVPNLGLVVPW
jgi:hypothetical protein